MHLFPTLKIYMTLLYCLGKLNPNYYQIPLSPSMFSLLSPSILYNEFNHLKFIFMWSTNTIEFAEDSVSSRIKQNRAYTTERFKRVLFFLSCMKHKLFLFLHVNHTQHRVIACRRLECVQRAGDSPYYRYVIFKHVYTNVHQLMISNF